MFVFPLLAILRRDGDEADEDDDVKSRLSKGSIAGIAVGVTIVLAVVIMLCWYDRHGLRRRKTKRRDFEDEEKPLPVDRTITPSASSNESPAEMQAGAHQRQVTESMTPAPVYSSVPDMDSSHNVHTGERESELEGVVQVINEIVSLKGKDHRLSAKELHGLELNSLEKRENHGNFQPGQELIHELPVDNIQSGNPSKGRLELNGDNYGSAGDGRLESDAISELPGSSVSGTTMMSTNMTSGTVSSIGTMR